MCLLQSEFQKRVLSPSPQKKSTLLMFKYGYEGTGHSSSDKCLLCSLCSACSFSTIQVLTAVSAMIGAARKKETFFQVPLEPCAWCSTASMCLANSAPFAGFGVYAALSRLDWNLLPMTLAWFLATVLNIVVYVCLCVGLCVFYGSPPTILPLLVSPYLCLTHPCSLSFALVKCQMPNRPTLTSADRKM